MNTADELRRILGSAITSLGRHPTPIPGPWKCTVYYQVDVLDAALLLKKLEENTPTQEKKEANDTNKREKEKRERERKKEPKKERERETKKERETFVPYPEYSPEFQSIWFEFPHRGQRSKKVASYKLWQAQGCTATLVLPWIEYAKTTEDWRKDGGRFVPGFQVWIRGRDFNEPPPVFERDKSLDPLSGLHHAALKVGLERGLDRDRIILAANELFFADSGDPTVESVLERASNDS